MLPTGSGGSGAGLLEKRVNASSGLGLADSVSLIGDYNHTIEDPMTLDSDAEWHNNHASDPATHTMNMADTAAFNADWNRPLESVLPLTDHVHAILDGYHAPANGGSDFSLDVIAGETVIYGAPAYIASNNTANLASAEDGVKSVAVGFITQAASANDATIVQTDGSVTLGNWEAITNTISLTPGSTYFLHTVAGQMRTTPPTGDGEVVVTLGVAVDTQRFDIEINEIAVL